MIAADTTRKIIIFNDAAAEVTGHRGEAALDYLNIRASYEGTGIKTAPGVILLDRFGHIRY